MAAQFGPSAIEDCLRRATEIANRQFDATKTTDGITELNERWVITRDREFSLCISDLFAELLVAPLEAGQEVVEEFVERELETITLSFNAASELLFELSEGARAELESIIDAQNESLLSITAALQFAVSSALDTIIERLNVVDRLINVQIENTLRVQNDRIFELTSQLSIETRRIQRILSTELIDLERAFQTIPGALQELGDTFKEIEKERLEAAGGISLSSILGFILDSITGNSESFSHDVTQNINSLNSIILSQAEQGSGTDQLFGASIVDSPILRTIIVTLASVLSAFAFANAATTPEQNKVLQAFSRNNPFQPLDTVSALEAHKRGFIDTQGLINELLKVGIPVEVTDILVRLTEQIIPVADLVVWWLREFIDKETFETRLVNQGFNTADIEKIEQQAFFLPPVQDLITMAVREVFSPEIAERFGQFEGFPREFAEFANQQGVSEEWARRYWAAHWVLPSVQMGFEMLHRGVINEANLDLLLRAQDVMPFWREGLKQIAFRPLTRVDIRRMHALGVLDDDGVRLGYLRLGYNMEDANRMLLFTQVYNEEVSTLGVDKERELSTSQVLRLFREGLLTKDEGIINLTDLGFNDQDSLLLINREEIDLELDNRKVEIDAILTLGRVGEITFEQATDRLHSLGLTPLEIKKATTTLIVSEANKAQTPAIDTLNEMFSQKVIDGIRYRQAMKGKGFSDFWIDSFIKLLGA